MPNPLLERLRSERDTLQATIDTICDGAAREERDLNDVEQANFEAARDRLHELDPRIEQLAEQERQRAAHVERIAAAGAAQSQPLVRSGHSEASDRRSWGERFRDSGIVEQYRGQGQRGVSHAVDVPFIRQETDAAPMLITAGSYPRVPQRLPGISNAAFAPIAALDMIGTSPMSAGVLEFVQEQSFTSAAAAVAEGAAKPESALQFQLVTFPAQTVAHWIPMTRQVLQDVPTLQAYVDRRLRYGLERALQDQAVGGTGVSPNISGLLTQLGAATAAVGTDPLEVIRAAMLDLILTTEYPVTGILVNAADYVGFEADLRKRMTPLGDRGYEDGPGIRPNLFGVPIAVGGVGAQEVVLGAFGLEASLHVREDVQVLISDSHADFFIRNQLVLLAETRAAMAVYSQRAFRRFRIPAPTEPEAARLSRSGK